MIKLTPEQQSVYDGSKGETTAKILKTLMLYGEIYGADKMVDVTSKYGHTVYSYGLKTLESVLDIFEELIEGNVEFKQKFTADPRPLDPNVPSDITQQLVFTHYMYSLQDRCEALLKEMGMKSDDDYTCACYLPQNNNRPKKGEILSWAESSAVVYANSVLGARCNRNSGIMELFGSAVGWVPNFGLLTDEGRKANWIIEVKTTKKPEAQVLGSAIGMKVVEDVPYVKGLDKWLGTELTADACAYLKDFGAATASNGAVGLYHIDKLTPEAVEIGESLIKPNAKVYIIDDEELGRVKNNYPVLWTNPDAKPELAFVGCPHLTMGQLKEYADILIANMKQANKAKVAIPTVFTTSPAVLKEFKETLRARKLKEMGVVVSYICPLMYMNNPLSKARPVITNSNKLRTYTTCRYYTTDEVLSLISGKEVE